MLKFVVDRKPGETDILSGFELKPLVIKALEGEVLMTLVPDEPWTYESLSALPIERYIGEQELFKKGADAYLGDQWVGSTEV